MDLLRENAAKRSKEAGRKNSRIVSHENDGFNNASDLRYDLRSI